MRVSRGSAPALLAAAVVVAFAASSASRAGPLRPDGGPNIATHAVLAPASAVVRESASPSDAIAESEEECRSHCLSPDPEAEPAKREVHPVVDARAEDSLAWLAARRCADGGWPGGDVVPCADPAASDAASAGPASDAGATGQALLAFMAAGYTNRSDDPHRYGTRIAQAVRGLKDAQGAEGAFVPAGSRTRLRDHAVATLAMVELFGMTGSSVHGPPAQRALEFLRRSRLASGAWPAGSEPGPEDAATTGWALLAFAVARLVNERDERVEKSPFFAAADLDVAPVRRWAERALSGPRRTVFLGLLAAIERASADGEALTNAVRDLQLEAHERAPSPTWVHFACIAARAAGGPARRHVTEALVLPLTLTRTRGVDPCDGVGSWESLVPDPDGLGLVAATALTARTMELWWSLEAPWRPVPAGGVSGR